MCSRTQVFIYFKDFILIKMNKNKLIENMDHELWTKFTAKCRIDGIKVVDRLKDYIRQDLEK